MSETLNIVELIENNPITKFFNISQTRNKYAFDYTIITDGYSVSLRFLHTNYVEAEKTKKNRMKEAKKALSGLTKEEKDKRKAEKETKLKEQMTTRPKPTKKAKTLITDDGLEKKVQLSVPNIQCDMHEEACITMAQFLAEI
jgi:hypothetical protein